MNRANVLFRGVLEFVGLVALSAGAWLLLPAAGVLRGLAALGLPLLAAALWGIFRTPGDDFDTGAVGAPPREPVVAVPGPVRLGIEFSLFGGAVALLGLAGQPLLAAALGGAVAVHYLLDAARVRWLLTAKRQEQ